MSKELLYHPGRDIVFYNDHCGRVVFQMRDGENSSSCAVRVEDPISGTHREIISLSLDRGSGFKRHYGSKSGCLIDTLASLKGAELPREAPRHLKRGIRRVITQAASGAGLVVPVETLYLWGVDDFVEDVGTTFPGIANPDFLTGVDDLKSNQYDAAQREEDELGLIEHLNSDNRERP